MLRALVLGDANCVDEDAAAALELFEPDAVAATNNMIIRWPGRLDYGCSLHIEPATDWCGLQEAVRRRVQEGRNRPQTWAHKAGRGVDRWTDDWAGSTGLMCVKVLLEEGFERIVLAGVPMTAANAHFYSEQLWSPGHYLKGWNRNCDRLKDTTRSMSGWTQLLLGAPTTEWLAGG